MNKTKSLIIQKADEWYWYGIARIQEHFAKDVKGGRVYQNLRNKTKSQEERWEWLWLLFIFILIYFLLKIILSWLQTTLIYFKDGEYINPRGQKQIKKKKGKVEKPQ